MNIYKIIAIQNPNWGIKGLSCFSVILVFISCIMKQLYKHNRIHLGQGVAYVMLFVYMWTVLESTVFTRCPQDHLQYKLQVFWSWRAVFLYYDKELLMDNFLNCMLLLPYGFLLPVAWGKAIDWKRGLLIGCTTSAVIEVLQLVTCRGLFEFDDIIHNGIGCMMGAMIVSRYYRSMEK